MCLFIASVRHAPSRATTTTERRAPARVFRETGRERREGKRPDERTVKSSSARKAYHPRTRAPRRLATARTTTVIRPVTTVTSSRRRFSVERSSSSGRRCVSSPAVVPTTVTNDIPLYTSRARIVVFVTHGYRHETCRESIFFFSALSNPISRVLQSQIFYIATTQITLFAHGFDTTCDPTASLPSGRSQPSRLSSNSLIVHNNSIDRKHQ